MVSIILATHGDMAKGLIDSANMLVGNTDKINVISLKPGVAPDAFLLDVEKTIKKVDDGSGVLAFVDIFGGTPNNTLYRAAAQCGIKLKIVTGVNLPMILSVLTEFDENLSLEELAKNIEQNGKEQIKVFG